MFILVSLSGLLYLRYKRPNMERPIKLNLAIPILFVVICTFLVFMPLYVRPIEVGMGLLITGSGIPVYLLCVKWKNKPEWFKNVLGELPPRSSFGNCLVNCDTLISNTPTPRFQRNQLESPKSSSWE